MLDLTRPEEMWLRPSTLLGLVSFGLVGAATILFFSIASFSFLYTSEGTPRDSGIRDRGFEVEPVLSDSFSYVHANRPPVPRETDLSGSAAGATVSIFPDRSAAHDLRPPEISEPLPPSASEGSGTAQTRPPEISEPLPPSASEGSAIQDASLSGTAQTVPVPAAQRDEVFRGSAMHHDQTANLGAPRVRMPIQNVQQGQSNDYYFSTNAAFWIYRLRKECGPIKDRALHADCVRSFRAQYPGHYASPTRRH
jgi:hypothetical protein